MMLNRCTYAIAAVLLAPGCFSDNGNALTGTTGAGSATDNDTCPEDCGSSGEGSGGGSADTGCEADCGDDTDTGCEADCGDDTDTGMDTGTDTGGSETGETGGTTGDSTDTGGDTGMDKMDVGPGTDMSGGMACAVNNDCAGFEVCSLGLGECIDADAAIYEVTVAGVGISSPSQCYGDVDEAPACEFEWYVVASVGASVEHMGPDLEGTNIQSLIGYSFLADLNVTDSFTIVIWDNDSNEDDMVDDQHLARTFAMSAMVLHDGGLMGVWNEGPTSKEIFLQLRAQ